MPKNLGWRIGVIIIAVAAAFYGAFPLKEKINLGLDLQGGMHLVLEVEADKAVENELIRLKDEVRKYLVKKKIRFRSAEIENHRLVVTFRDIETREDSLT